MLEIIKEASDNLIPQMTIVGSKNAPLAKKSGSKITGTAVPFELAHPRYPKNAVGGKGGEFMEKGSNDYKMAVANNLVQAVKQGRMPLENAQKTAKNLGIAKKSPAVKQEKSFDPNAFENPLEAFLSLPEDSTPSVVKKPKQNATQPTEKRPDVKQEKSFDPNAFENPLEAFLSLPEDFTPSVAEESAQNVVKKTKQNATQPTQKTKQYKNLSKQLKERAKKYGENAPITKWVLTNEEKQKWHNTLSKTSESGFVGENPPNPKAVNPNAPPPTQQQVDALWAYTGTSVCQAVNATMRGMLEDQPYFESVALGIAQKMRDGLKGIPSFDKNVYRGTLIPQDVASKLKIGSTYQDFGFMSTSADKGIAQNFAEGIVLGKGQNSDIPAVFVIKNGHQGKSIAPISKLKHEEEVLFDAGSQFKVIDIIQAENAKYPEIHLEQIQPDKQIDLQTLSDKAKKWQNSRAKKWEKLQVTTARKE